jgi:hypothetical protein
MGNLDVYNKYRQVPAEALKPFDNGNFKGTDINSMWRVKCLTEQFGVIGHGWTTRVLRVWLETCEYTNEVYAFAEIEMQVKIGDDWGKPFTATGGNKFCTYVKSKDYYKGSDEAFKMAITDAFGVACKYLGIGADVYWQNDKSKYTENQEEKLKNKPTSQENKKVEQVVKKEEQPKVEVMTLEKAKETTFEAKGKVYKVGECSNEQLFYLRDNAKDQELLDAVKLVLMDKAKTGNVTDENHD